jgi:hypothetical protein
MRSASVLHLRARVARSLARSPLPACGILLVPESFRDPDRYQLSWSNLLPPRDTPKPIQRPRVERDSERLWRRASWTDLNGLSFGKEPCELLITAVSRGSA